MYGWPSKIAENAHMQDTITIARLSHSKSRVLCDTTPAQKEINRNEKYFPSELSAKVGSFENNIELNAEYAPNANHNKKVRFEI